MAGANYAHCEACGAKALYDAEVDYESASLGALAVLCRECVVKGLRLGVVKA